MSRRIRTILLNVGGFGLAALLLFLAVRGVDLAEILDALRGADYRWLAPVVIVLLGSHYLRAIRWCALMDVLEGDASPKNRHGIAFSSIMIGYMVNYAAPRLGEVARTANYSRLAGPSFSGVLGSVVAERVLDVIALAIGLAIVLVMLSGRAAGLAALLFEGQDIADFALLGAAALLTLVLGVGLLIVFARLVRRSNSARFLRWTRRVRPVVRSFRDGILAAINAPRRWTIVLTTIAMWMCYGIAAYIPFVMLGMTTDFEIGPAAAWVMMILGSLGVVVPAPGGVGSYHYITIQGLVFLYATSASAAASYAFLTHAAQFVLYVLVGTLAIILQSVAARRRLEAVTE